MLNTLSPSIRINNVIKESIVDGFGLRFVIFTQGCLLRCKNCHNPSTHDLDKGDIVALETLQEMWKKNPLLKGITISGGEPFLQKEATLNLVRLAKKDNLDVTIYTGYTYDALKKQDCDIINNIFNEADYLIDGPFIDCLKDLNLLFRGSKNQRIIDLNKTKIKGELVFYEE